MPDYATIPNVEIATAGIEWPASTGDVTITFEHLADAVRAANDDPHVQAGRVKLGHGIQLVGDLGDHDPAWDGQPAFGSLANLRLENEGAVLVADLIEVPVWLADAAPSAYPTRSMEAIFDHTTEGGKHYRMVITGLALGSWRPAVADLEDLERLVTEGAGIELSERNPMPETTSASVDVDVVRRRFNYEWAMDPDSFEGEDTYWWWARSIRVDPSEIVADDDDGGLWRVPYSTDGEDEVTFGEPERVRETFVPVAASAATQAIELARPDKPDPTAASSSEGPETEQEEHGMAVDLDALRERLGLSEDATDEQINEAITAAAESAETEQTETTEPEAGEAAETTEAEVTETEPVAASTVQVDRETWEQVQSQAQDGAEARREQVCAHRAGVLDAAVKAGRIPSSRRDHYAAMFEADAEGTERLLTASPEDGGLAPNTIPVTEIGVAASEGDSATHARIMQSFGVATGAGKE